MAYTSLTATSVQSGKPTAADTGDLIRTNLDDHEARLSANELATNTFDPFELEVTGSYNPFVGDGLVYKRIDFDINVLSGQLLIYTAGASGTTEIDIEYKRGAGAWTTIFTTKPSVAQAAGNLALSTNGVLTSGITSSGLLAGDILRLNLDGAQVGGIGLAGIVRIEKA